MDEATLIAVVTFPHDEVLTQLCYGYHNQNLEQVQRLAVPPTTEFTVMHCHVRCWCSVLIGAKRAPDMKENAAARRIVKRLEGAGCSSYVFSAHVKGLLNVETAHLHVWSTRLP